MRSIQSAGVGPAMLALLALLVTATPAAAVQIALGSDAADAGETVDIDITTTDLTGLGVQSYEFTISFTAGIVSAVSTVEAGTLTDAAGWGAATFNPGAGTLTVTHAGVTPLSGSGTLLTLRFLVEPPPTSGSTNLTWQNFIFNEGSPIDTTSNGSITRTATPTIFVSPNTGEVLSGESLAFNVFGSATPPFTWGTTDAGVATIDGSGVLTGVSAGNVRVFAIDNVGITDTTDNIVVRAVRTTAGTASPFVGQQATIPVSVTDLTGLGVRSGEIRIIYSTVFLNPVGISTTGTLLDGYGNTYLGGTPGEVVVDFAGTTDLAGSGVLVNLIFDTVASGGAALTMTEALYNETLESMRVNGLVSILALPTITVLPHSITLLAGETQQMTLAGSPTPPITWSTLDPAVAAIDASGLLTAVAGGVTQVQAVDDVGASDLNTSVTVYDFAVAPGVVQGAPGDTVEVPILLDRNVDALGIFSTQYAVSFSPTYLTPVAADATGIMSSWGTPVSNPLSGQLIVAGAGAMALGPGTTLNTARIAISPSAPIPTDIPLTLSQFLCNEGNPIGQVGAGEIEVRMLVDVPRGDILAFGMQRAVPNPAQNTMRFSFTIPDESAGRADLAIYSIDGRRVRTLIGGNVEPGTHDALWRLSDDRGARVPPGVYFAALEWGTRRVLQKVVVVK